jgi:hypothetical protein
MLSTATALIQATEDSIFDEEVMGFAAAFCDHAKELDSDQFARSMYAYSCMLASLAIDKATKVLLTETELIELMSSIDEMETLRNEVLSDGE